jgi:hypothetical protein
LIAPWPRPWPIVATNRRFPSLREGKTLRICYDRCDQSRCRTDRVIAVIANSQCFPYTHPPHRRAMPV